MPGPRASLVPKPYTSPTDLPPHQMAWTLAHLTINWPRTLGTIPSLSGPHLHRFLESSMLWFSKSLSAHTRALPCSPLASPHPQFLEPSWLSTKVWFCEYSSSAGLALCWPTRHRIRRPVTYSDWVNDWSFGARAGPHPCHGHRGVLG